jgi:16S rRNA (cytidine1402-2'-O)-methyltransferase|tara:strand:+ start:259 stop:975 length:717 start_codon:yes stop_codon:yes gene_type:complete
LEIKKSTLYIIPSFIGSNDSLEHISKYNLRIIDEINYFIVESEKKSRRFIKKILPTKNQDDLTFFQIKKNKNVINNENYLNPLIKGQNMGLMSDSGNPVIADPGASIINTAHFLKINVKPLVGPSSILLALISSGMKGQRFTFNGYLPINSKERIKELKFLEKKSKKNDETQIFIETPYRNNQLLDLTKRVLSQDTQLSVASCLDSKEEKIISLSISEWKKEEVDLNKKPTVFLIDAK